MSQYIQARDVEKAMDAFTSAVQLDPDNGEAWNNIACLYALSQFLNSNNYANIMLRTCFLYIFLFFGSSPFPARCGFTSYEVNFFHMSYLKSNKFGDVFMIQFLPFYDTFSLLIIISALTIAKRWACGVVCSRFMLRWFSATVITTPTVTSLAKQVKK